MSHVKDITSKQIFGLHNQLFQAKRLHNLLDNSGQAVWTSLGLAQAVTNARLANMLDVPADSPKVGEAFKALKQFHSNLFADAPPTLPKTYPQEQVKRYLSLLSSLLPAHDDFGREAIQETIKRLKLGTALRADKMPEILPGLIASLQTQVGRG